jgi:membrane protein DedA with SNARE-associated domain/membrane-associated phospholipid phosphatase
MELIQSVIHDVLRFLSPEHLSAHPDLALLIVFLIAFGEALLIIGLFVPSTVILVGAGTMVGTGHLAFWPVFAATAVGAIAGDQISYWAGRWYGDKLKTMWPLNRHPQLAARGEEYVRQHGGKSIAIGRFVPGVKAVVPGIVGMLGMSQVYFLLINISSGLVWTAFHIVPGILIGQGLAVAGEMSERLVIVLLLLLCILAITGWLIRLASASLAPYVDTVLGRCSISFRSSKNRTMQRFGRALSPTTSSSRLIILFLLLFLAALVGLADLLFGFVVHGAISNMDLTTSNLLSQLRSEPGDRLMVFITMLGDKVAVAAVGAAIAIWLIWRRAWRAALAAVTAMVAAYATTVVFKLFGTNSRMPSGISLNTLDSYVFPSAHAVLAGTVFGMVALLVSVGRGRWTRALIISIFASAVIAISFSRLYLGVNWLSDVLGGLALATLICSAFGIVVETLPTRQLRPLSFMAIAGAVVVAISLGYSGPRLNANIASYAPVEKSQTLTLQQLQEPDVSILPMRRITLAGRRKDPFSAIWVGDILRLKAALLTAKWQERPSWSWTDGINYTNTHFNLADLAPQPLLHEGEAAVLTAILEDASMPNVRLVFRAYKSHAQVQLPGKFDPVFLIHLSEEQQRLGFKLFNVPSRSPATFEQVAQLNATIGTATGTELLSQRDVDGAKLAVYVSK